VTGLFLAGRLVSEEGGFLTNLGRTVLGTIDDRKKHAEMMRKKPKRKHVDPNQISVEPGKTGDLIWRFTRGGTSDFACLEPGHFEAGRIGEIAVDREGE
jgi:uncharacterized cupredoxin-like copper-binding protein